MQKKQPKIPEDLYALLAQCAIWFFDPVLSAWDMAQTAPADDGAVYKKGGRPDDPAESEKRLQNPPRHEEAGKQTQPYREKPDKKIVYLYLGKWFTEFEYAIAADMISEKNPDPPRIRSCEIVTFGTEKAVVHSLAGLTAVPDTDIEGVDTLRAAIVILPGAADLRDDDNPRLARLLRECHARGIPIAAICGGTVFLARCGFLNTVRHTSNGPGFLKERSPEYAGGALYEHAPCVSDKGIITANPFGNVEFACEIFRALGIMTSEAIGFFLQAYKKGYVNTDFLSQQQKGRAIAKGGDSS